MWIIIFSALAIAYGSLVLFLAFRRENPDRDGSAGNDRPNGPSDE
jgi:hypothetical protein